MSDPVQFQWDGEAMVPASRFWARKADEQFTVGQRYRMVEENERSDVSHNHQFAFVKEAWDSFPDHLCEQFPSPEHLRKFGLIRKGFCTMKQYPCKSAAEAERMMVALKVYADKYALVTIEGSVVTVREAESQAYRAMSKERFQASKQALLEYIGGLIGVDPETLANVREAA